MKRHCTVSALLMMPLFPLCRKIPVSSRSAFAVLWGLVGAKADDKHIPPWKSQWIAGTCDVSFPSLCSPCPHVCTQTLHSVRGCTESVSRDTWKHRMKQSGFGCLGLVSFSGSEIRPVFRLKKTKVDWRNPVLSSGYRTLYDFSLDRWASWGN